MNDQGGLLIDFGSEKPSSGAPEQVEYTEVPIDSTEFFRSSVSPSATPSFSTSTPGVSPGFLPTPTAAAASASTSVSNIESKSPENFKDAALVDLNEENENPEREFLTKEEEEIIQARETAPRDVWFAYLFYVHVIVGAIIFFVGITEYSKSYAFFSPFRGNASQILGLTFGVGIFACILCWLWLKICNKNPLALLWLSAVSNLILPFSFAIWSFVQTRILLGLVLLFFTFAAAFLYYNLRSRFNFASVILGHISEQALKYQTASFIALAGIVIQGLWIITWLFTLILSYNRNYVSRAGAYLLGTFLFFSFYWTFQVIKNVLHVTISSQFSQDYMSGSPVQPHVFPDPRTFQHLKRSLTTSFGSICLGSLLVAVLQTLHSFLRIFAQLRRDKPVIAHIAQAASFLLAFIERALRYFNMYAFTHVALYNKTFCLAAHDTWELFQSRGFAALINDTLIDNLLNLLTIMTGLLCSAFGLAIASLSGCTISGQAFSVVMSFLVGVVVVQVPITVVQAGVCSVFVCLAQQPEALKKNFPDLYASLTRTFSLGGAV